MYHSGSHLVSDGRLDPGKESRTSANWVALNLSKSPRVGAVSAVRSQ